ncbi:hypothetical protein Tco_0530433 [Tanacetum coccineum]
MANVKSNTHKPVEQLNCQKTNVPVPPSQEASSYVPRYDGDELNLKVLVFSVLCYPTNDSEDLGKLQPTADIGIFVGYAPSKKGQFSLTRQTSSTTIDQDAPSPSHSPSSLAFQSPSLHTGITADSTLMEDNPFSPIGNHPFINVFAPKPCSEASTSGDLSSVESPYVSQTLHHLGK